MKNFLLVAVCTVLSALFTISCNIPAGDHKYFDSKLLGTWVSNEPGLYSGTLKFDFDTLTIDGYGEDWLSLVGDDSKRPFKDFPKRGRLKAIRKKEKSSSNTAALRRVSPTFILKQGLIRLSINYWNSTLAAEKKYYRWIIKAGKSICHLNVTFNVLLHITQRLSF